MLLDVLRHLCQIVSNVGDRCVQVDTEMRIALGAGADRDLGDVVATAAVADEHVERGGRRALLVVAVDRHTVEARATKQQALQLVGVAVVVEVDVAMRRKEGVEVGVRQRVRVRAFQAQDHQVRHVDDADGELRLDVAQVGGRRDHLEHHLGADADQHDVRVGDAAVACAGELPNARAGFAVRLGFVGTQPDGLVGFGAYDEVDVILGPEAVGEGGQKSVGVWGQVHPGNGCLEVQHGPNKAWALMRIAIVLLAGPRARLDVVETVQVLSPARL